VSEVLITGAELVCMLATCAKAPGLACKPVWHVCAGKHRPVDLLRTSTCHNDKTAVYGPVRMC
jgi:hypothetical protein